jgi:hypothetical protein
MSKTIRVFSVLSLLLWNLNGFSQVVYPDFGMWNTISIEKKLNKKISVSIDEEFRLKENLSRINLFYTNLGVNYKFSKKLKAALIYRNTQKNADARGYDIKHRIMIDIIYKEKLSKKFNLTFRQRFQFENENIFSSNDGKYIESFLRSKFDLSYNITKKIKTSLSEELRFQLHDPRNDETDYGLRRFRHCLGIDYDISSKSTMGAYYLIQNEITTYKPNELYIFGLQYSFQL